MASTGTGGTRRRRGGVVTAAMVGALLVGLAATLFGSGLPENAIASYDASAWLWSAPKGEMARVNGLTGRVDTRFQLTDGVGHNVEVAQTDRYVIVHDVNTGKLSMIDLAGLQVAATAETTPGAGITIAVRDNVAFVVDGVQGLVRQLDPATLGPVGQPLRFPPGLTGGTFDESGRLWVLIPSEGTVAAILPAAGATADPVVARSVPLTPAAHDVALTVLDDGVAVLDNTASQVVVLVGTTPRTIPVKLDGPGTVPARTTGPDIPVTVAEGRTLVLINGDAVAERPVPGNGADLAPCVAWRTRFYCPDNATGTVYVVDRDGRETGSIPMPNSGGRLDLEIREGHLFINAPGSSTARVVDDQHKVMVVDKYANNVPGGDPPLPPPPPPKPTVGPPSAPARVTAVAGNAQARVTWTAATPNGAPILRYVVEGGGTSVDVGANQRTVTVTGLTNGTEYRFSVHAVNSKGAGPKRTSNPVVPTAEVPDPPPAITAEARPDGTVALTWPPANGQGRKVVRYEVTAVTRAAPVPAGDSTSTTLVIPAGRLTYGTQYAFTVVSISDRGASSSPSPLSNTVTPFTTPGQPKGLSVVAANRRGSVDVSWQPADDNGRAVEHYVVTGGGQRQEVTGTSISLSGLPDGASVQVSVRAVNAAGEGPPVSRTVTTIDLPKVSLTGASGAYTAITVSFTITDGGSPATCVLAVAGGGQASGNCSSLTAAAWPGRTFGWTVTVTNAAGSATATGTTATPTLSGTVLCGDPSYCGRGAARGGIWIYRTPSQNGSAVDDVFSPDQYVAVCQTPDSRGATIDARPWGGKVSSTWVRIRFPAGQENYIPFAWFRLAEGDNLGLLPRC